MCLHTSGGVATISLATPADFPGLDCYCMVQPLGTRPGSIEWAPFAASMRSAASLSFHRLLMEIYRCYNVFGSICMKMGQSLLMGMRSKLLRSLPLLYTCRLTADFPSHMNIWELILGHASDLLNCMQVPHFSSLFSSVHAPGPDSPNRAFNVQGGCIHISACGGRGCPGASRGAAGCAGAWAGRRHGKGGIASQGERPSLTLLFSVSYHHMHVL